MGKEVVLSKLNQYNRMTFENKHVRACKNLAIVLAYIVHMVMLVPFVCFACVAFEDINAMFLLKDYPFVTKMVADFPLYTASVKDFIICSVASLILIPLAVAILTMVIGRFIKPKVTPLDESKHPIALVGEIRAAFGTGYFYHRFPWWLYSVIAALFIAGISTYYMKKTGAAMFNTEGDPESTKTFIDILTFILQCLGLTLISVATGILKLFLGPIYSDSTKYWVNYRKEMQACEEFEKTLKADNEREEKAKAKRKEDERLAKLAEAAENQWQSLEDPTADWMLARKLANEGSPSACLYIGRKMYDQYLESSYTKSEKKQVAGQIIKYLSPSAMAGNVDSDFMILALTVDTKSGDVEEWKALLEKAREIENSGKLSEEFQVPFETQRARIIDCIDRGEALRKDTNREPVFERKYCRFCDHGTCRYFPNQYSVATCKYIDDPGQCSIALAEKSIEYVFK